MGLLVVALYALGNKHLGVSGGYVQVMTWVRRPRMAEMWQVWFIAGLILGWLVLVLTDSSSQLGLVIFLYGVPNLAFVLFGGIIADRIDRRKMLISTQATVTVIIFIFLRCSCIAFCWVASSSPVSVGFRHNCTQPELQATSVGPVS